MEGSLPEQKSIVYGSREGKTMTERAPLPRKIIIKQKREEHHPEALVDFIAGHKKVELSKAIIKEAMTQGSCWVRKGNSKLLKRVRRAKTVLMKGDYVEFYFDADLYETQKAGLDSEPVLISEHRDWSVWNKPAGWLSQGTKYGDSFSLLRHVEKLKGKEVFLVHRLDKETSGLMIVAHNNKAAKGLGTLWATQKVRKLYWAECLGHFKEQEGTVNSPVDNKEAVSHYKVLETREKTDLVEVIIETGRKHQIRLHMLALEHPVMGDPRYGRGNKNKDGMKLVAAALKFRWAGSAVEVKLDECPL